MNRLLTALCLLVLVRLSAQGQSLDELNIQLHGYATQGFLYSTQNNWNTTQSSDGSPAWTEAVFNLTSQPDPKLRVAAQARYYLLGTNGNQITLDWALADYKVNDKIGFRAGKVKTPAQMLNEMQDVDPSQLWVLLPQSIYAIASRSSTLSHYGGVTYGTLPIGETHGKLQYRGYGGQRIINGQDGLFQALRDKGISLPNGTTGPMYGGTVNYVAPIQGLMAGASLDSEHPGGAATLASFTGYFQASHFYQPSFYAQYQHKRVMAGGEYTRQALYKYINFVNGPKIFVNKDQRSFYAMATYQITGKLGGGAYYSSTFDEQVPQSSARFQKDWTVAARYDFNQFLYVKAEQHFIDGTYLGYSTSDNAAPLLPTTLLTVLKLGVSF